MPMLLHELRLALRHLRRSPGATALAIVVLSLGIGGTSAMFNVADALLFEPYAFAGADRMMSVVARHGETGEPRAFSFPELLELRDGSTSFTGLAAHAMSMATITDGEVTRRRFVELVSAGYFGVFGVQPSAGRFFDPDEEGSGARVAVVSHGFHGNGDRPADRLGETLTIDGLAYTVIGVAPPGFGGTSVLFSPDLWLPAGAGDSLRGELEDGVGRSLHDRSNRVWMVFGRLGPGVDRESATADTARLAALAPGLPGDHGPSVYEVHPISRVSGSWSPETDAAMATLSALLISMAVVLMLVAGLNLATLQGARGLARRREIAVRFALGCGRPAVIRQLMAESLLLALAAGLLGLGVAWAVPRLLLASVEPFAPFQLMLRPDLDWRVLAATVGFCLLAAAFVGLLPAWRASRPDLVADLAEKADGGGARRGRWIAPSDLPVLLEIAFSMVLLVAAGLFLRSAFAASHVDPGFELDRHAILEIDSGALDLDEAAGRALHARLEARLERLPGVRAVSRAATVPFGMLGLQRTVAPAEAGEDPDDRRRATAAFNVAGPDYFSTVGIPLLRGRTFRPSERAEVAVVDELLARRLWPGAEAVGRRLRIVGEEELEVVGVVGAVRDTLLEPGLQPHLWLSGERRFLSGAHLHLRFDAEPDAAVLAGVRAAVREVEPRLPVLRLRSMRDHLDSSAQLWLLRTAARLFAAFAGIALVLTLVGVYGVRAFSVARRTREIGIRMALGSSVADTLRSILREGVRVALLGSLVGLLLAAGAARLLARFLFAARADDPVVFGAALALLLTVSVVACVGPARRAARVDPLVALRAD